jgi:uncharacterized protein with FMN-binding domain
MSDNARHASDQLSVKVAIKDGKLTDLDVLRGVGPQEPKNLNDVLDPTKIRQVSGS